MKYWIFGGNGFTGRFLTLALAERDAAVAVCDTAPQADGRIRGACLYRQADIRDKESLGRLDIGEDDVVINLAANQYHAKVPRRGREEFFFSVNARGAENILGAALGKGCRRCLMFSTDMVYGKPLYLPVDAAHPQNPFGPYGRSKKECERICRVFRGRGMDITVMRPRMIIGPGRLGVLVKLFRLIDMGLPVPTVGSGRNRYQMISVFDCVSAVLRAIDKGLPNKEYNLGSENPPAVRDLLKGLIRHARSRSPVVPTWGPPLKLALGLLDAAGLPLMYREQFMIADEEYVLDISETVRDLGWRPQFGDGQMLEEAWRIYKESRTRPLAP